MKNRIQTWSFSWMVARFLDTWRKDEAEAMFLIVASRVNDLAKTGNGLSSGHRYIQNSNENVATGGQGGRGGSGASVSSSSSVGMSSVGISVGDPCPCGPCGQ